LDGLEIITVAGHERMPQAHRYCGNEAIGTLKRCPLSRGFRADAAAAR
jgi:hypothetical protein